MKKFSVFVSLFLFGLFLSPALTQAGALYDDVYDTDSAVEALTYLTDYGVVEGYGDGTFHPLGLINRAEFTKMVVEGVLGVTPDETFYRNCFPDVNDEWYAKYVCYAKGLGWVEGYPDGFHPADNIMRSEAVKIVGEAYEWENLGTLEYSRFSDNQAESAWFHPYLMKAEERGLFDTLDYYISPNELITRKQMSVLLYRAMNNEAGTPVEVASLSGEDLSYEDVLATGLTANYPGDMDFPAYSQSGWSYGCYTFAVKNVLAFKYDFILNVSEMQDRIGWDGAFIWTPEEAQNFATEYDVDDVFTYNGTAEFFLKKLAMGDPMVLYIPYYVGSENIGHQVAAYSFDENGVWIADSLSGGVQRQIPWSDVFVDGAHFTTNLTELRQMKGGAEYKTQGF
ncbi:MAG: S-layer homology domain-containing protein [Candidatus Gracilibacteria bacterium]